MYKYKLTEDSPSPENFQQERIDAFSILEDKLQEIKKLLRQGKLATIKYYRVNPQSYNVVKGTDLIGEYLKDIETLLKEEE
jgi:hypothetical protein